MLTCRAESLSTLPAQWHTMIDAPKSSKHQTNQSPSTHQQAGAEPTFNANADTRLMTRYRKAGFSTITAMMGENEVETPKHAGKEVCLSWAPKGSCSATCKRKTSHVCCPRDTIKEIHKVLDAWGVPNGQP